jgi:N-acyl-D-aspartate/D-glutamate deacylase
MAACIALPAAAGQDGAAQQDSSDLLIHGGTVIDGTGSPGRRADVLIHEGLIVRVGLIDRASVRADRLIDAAGLIVTPGFIDAHSHGDPLATPEFENFLAMGVTTICLGQDGDSPREPAAWMRKVEAAGVGPNVALFIGHGAVRDAAGVGISPDPEPGQIAAMRGLVREALAAGCFGLTTGLEYQPGSFAGADELGAIARPVAAAGGVVMSHLRSEDDDKIEAALEELLAQGRAAGCPVHVSHLKVTYGRGAARAERVLAQLQAARGAGLRVTADIYPYNASYTGIGIVFPDWAKPPHDYAEVVRTRRADLAEFLRVRVAQRNGPEATLLGTGPWRGKTLAAVADELGKPFEDVLIDDIGLGGASAAYFVMDDELQQRLLVDPHVMISSDGSPTGHHPRGHGTFARIISEYAHARGALTIEEAVRKMTGLTAETIGLDRLKRGRLEEGWAADVLVFDPRAVREAATYDAPHQLATGFDYVIVNGAVVREAGRSTGVRGGKVLRRAEMSLSEKAAALVAGFDRPDAPGGTIAILRNGEVAYAAGFGLADVAAKTRAEPQTNYRLASVSKQFTAMAIMTLKQRGALGYDDPISQYFPDFPPIGRQITIRHLLWHTSGVIDYESLMPPDQAAQLKDRDVLALLQAQQGTYFTPGTQYRYSNSGYALLALIVEQVSGRDFATFLRENIFEPLGMTDTVAYEQGVSEVKHRAMGYRESSDGFVDADQSLTSAVLGDGGIYSSVVDYAKWDRALEFGGLVSRETLDEAFTLGELANGSTTGYGFGWRIEQRRGQTVIHHDGSTSGFSNAVRRLPGDGLTIVVLMNRAGGPAADIADELLDWALLANGESAAAAEVPAVAADAAGFEWVDATTLTLEGRGWADAARPYRRLPARAEALVTPAVWQASQHAAGIAVRFVTDSPRIAAIWDGGRPMAHMAATANCGLDLYRRGEDGAWVFCGVGKPRPWRTTATLASRLPAEPTEYMLCLPLYKSVSELQIGVDAGASLRPGPVRETRPIVFYGTSMTQGGCASRAGMGHASILGRRLDREVINLGFSGAGKMEPAMADLLGELDASLYVLECLPNMTTAMVAERVEPFVRRLRGLRPATPILLVESPLGGAGNAGNAALREAHAKLEAGGVTGIHYLVGPPQLAGAENGTVDGTHPTDLGFERMAGAYEPVVRGILAGK